MMTILSSVNRKRYVEQQRDYHAAIVAKHAAMVDELNAELATMDEEIAGGGKEGSEVVETQSSKRRRVL